MGRCRSFFKTLVKEVVKDEIVSLANELTYKLLLALFPFIIFLMTLLGFLNIDGYRLLSGDMLDLPPQILNMLSLFIDEVISTKSPKLLSTSLLISIFSASSGFNAIIRGVNISYGHNDCRNFITIRLISIVLVFVFAVAVICCAASIIFGEYILAFFDYYYNLPNYMVKAISLAGVLGSLLILLCATCFIYKLSNCHKTRFISVLPGAVITVVIWVLASKGFNIYINNFSRYSVVYGSIGSIFILMFWLNLIAFVLLIGSEINALLEIE